MPTAGLVRRDWCGGRRRAGCPSMLRTVLLPLARSRVPSRCQLRCSRIWRLIRASIAAMPRSRSGLTRSCNPSWLENSPGVARTSSALSPCSPACRMPAKPRVVGASGGASKNRWTVASCSTSAAVSFLVLGIAGVSYFAYRESAAKKEAQASEKTARKAEGKATQAEKDALAAKDEAEKRGLPNRRNANEGA